MACRILVTDAPQPVQLQLTAPVDEADVLTIETAVRLALDDGHDVVVDIAVHPLSEPLRQCLVRLAAAARRHGSLTYRGADIDTARQLRGSGVSDRVHVETAGS